MSVLGIDFGTSYSSASFVNADGKPEAIMDAAQWLSRHE